MKLGFDVHGVVDTFDIFPKLIQKLLNDPDVEIHIITGLSKHEAPDQIGHLVDLSKVKYFSIVDYLISNDVPVRWKYGRPWADDDEWNQAKAIYCVDNEIDIIIDDSPTYAKYFDNIDTIYCQIHNINRQSRVSELS
jgi:hypothetical protein